MDTMSDLIRGNRRYAAALVPLSAALLVAACGNGDAPPATETQTETQVRTETVTETGTGTGTETVTDTPTDLCPAADLVGSVSGVEGAAGSQYITIALDYRGDGQCVLRGFPGVSAVDGSGNQVGEAAEREDEPASEVLVTPANPATFTVRLSRVQAESGCGTADATGFRIYPPGSRETLETVAHPMKICVDPPTVMLWTGPVAG